MDLFQNIRRRQEWGNDISDYPSEVMRKQKRRMKARKKNAWKDEAKVGTTRAKKAGF